MNTRKKNTQHSIPLQQLLHKNCRTLKWPKYTSPPPRSLQHADSVLGETQNNLSQNSSSILLNSIPDCVLPLQEAALHQSPPSFSVLCYPHPYRSLLPHNVISPTMFSSSNWSYTLYLPLCASVHLLPFERAMCPAHFHFELVTYWTMSVTLCLMMVFGLCLSAWP